MKLRLGILAVVCTLSLVAWLGAPAPVRATADCNIGNTTSPSGCDNGCLDFGFGPVTSQFPCGTFAVTLESRPPGGTWSFTGQSSNQHSGTIHYCPSAGTFEYRFKLTCKNCGPTIEYYALGTFTCP